MPRVTCRPLALLALLAALGVISVSAGSLRLPSLIGDHMTGLSKQKEEAGVETPAPAPKPAAQGAASSDSLLLYVGFWYYRRRGRWYDVSWKGKEEKSGGVAMNIGVHFFDLVTWLFGPVVRSDVHLSEERRLAGVLELEGAVVRWFLSVDAGDLPDDYLDAGRHAYRSLQLDGREIEFSDGFADLHTRSYEQVLQGKGFGLEEARRSIRIVHHIRHSPVVDPGDEGHPLLD